MKHIRKSFFLQEESINFNKSNNKEIKWEDVSTMKNEVLKQKNGEIVFAQTTKNETVGGFVQKIDNEYFFFPVPDPTLVYFHTAQMGLLRLKELKKNLIKKLKSDKIKEDIPIHDLYNYYGYSTSVIINLFTALESFLNQQIQQATHINEREIRVRSFSTINR
jgi:hypothetical protein